MLMPSGGHANSGPAPDPNALRRNRADDAGWTVLPGEGFAGEVPGFPLEEVSALESELWGELWRKPQAIMWAKLDMRYQIAAYVRAFLESVRADSSAGLKTAVLRMEAELGLSLPGMHSLRWKFSEDELADKRDDPGESAGPSARDRWKARTGA